MNTIHRHLCLKVCDIESERNEDYWLAIIGWIIK